MTVPKRALTFNFEKSVSQSSGVAAVLEVVVAPLAVSSAPNLDAILVGPSQTQSVSLATDTAVVFYLVPTDYPELTQRVPYRAAWREKYLGRQYTYDFSMPDADVDFDDLHDLGNIIGGVSYLQRSELSNPNGVAALNELGQVVDYLGEPVTGAAEAAVVQGNLESETVARQQADSALRDVSLQYTDSQIAQVYSSTTASRATEVQKLENADTIERSARQNGDMLLHAGLTSLRGDTNAQVVTINNALLGVEQQLGTKADLDANGKILTSQIPAVSIGTSVTVANQAEMLALTSSQVQPGDFAVRPDGVWFLKAAPPSNINNWIPFSSAGQVISVNGQTGAVSLAASDVGARPAATLIPQNDVMGLSATFGTKADKTTTTTISNRVSAIENDASIVKTSGSPSEIPRAVSGSYLVYLDAQDRLTKKNGSLLTVSGGSGGVLDVEDITGLPEALNAKQDKADPATPVSHATTHAQGGSDPLTLTQAQVTGLAPIVANNQLTATSSHETRIAALEVGGSGGGGADIAKAVWFNGGSVVGQGNPDGFKAAGVQLRGPFSRNSSGNYSYNPGGVAPVGEDYVYAYVTPNGHLQLRKWDETAPADSPPATQADLAATNAQIASKANQASVDTLTTTVNGKASQTSVDNLTTTVANKANQSALDTTNTTVAGKAAQSDMTTAQTNITNLQTTKADKIVVDPLALAVTNKADLVSGTVPLAQLPTLPTSKVTNLDTTLANKADLTGGQVPVAQLPAVPTSKVVNLDPILTAKADLDGAGKILQSQIPAIALNSVVTVANKSAMLALNTNQVQSGDVCVITGTADQGSYILSASDPSVEANWIKMAAPSGGAVATVNGQSGVVVLSAADVGARSSGTLIPQADVTNLLASLAAKADTATVNTALATKPSLTDVQTFTTQAQQNKLGVDLVATSAVSTLSGQQSIDGVLAPLGSRVLLTAQSSSAANGIYTVVSGAWQRVIDMAANNYFVKGSVVTASGGANHLNTFWQQTADSGVVGTNSNNWSKIMTAGAPPNFTASLGVQRVGNEFRAQVVSAGGLQATASGLQLDPNLASRKYVQDVPATGSTLATITHNLGTLDVSATFRDKASGDFVLVGWKPTGINTISVEFNSPLTTTGAYRVVIFG